MKPVITQMKKDDEQKYEKAKKDVLQAAISIGDLTPSLQEQLAKELFGTATVLAMYRMMKRFLG